LSAFIVMKIKQLFSIISLTNILFFNYVLTLKAQETGSVTNNNNENVDITVQESGSQTQGQSANGNTSDVTITDNEKSDNFWSDSYRGQVSIPPGSASLTCGEQNISYSRSGGVGLGVGAAGFNLSDNAGSLPEEFQHNLAAIRQCAKEKNAAEIVDKYLELRRVDRAIANAYLRTVSPEIYATFFVENGKEQGDILTEKTFNELTTKLREEDFNQVVEWQDNFYGAGLEEKRVELRENQELHSIERDQRLRELGILELERRAKEVEAIIKQKQSELNNVLEPYQQ
jgi:hypothetical protein